MNFPDPFKGAMDQLQNLLRERNEARFRVEQLEASLAEVVECLDDCRPWLAQLSGHDIAMKGRLENCRRDAHRLVDEGRAVLHPEVEA